MKTKIFFQQKNFFFQLSFAKNEQIYLKRPCSIGIAQLADQIYESFENNNYTFGIFVNFSKAFDTVDHTILLKKLEINGITGANLAWFRNYITNRKQYIVYLH